MYSQRELVQFCEADPDLEPSVGEQILQELPMNPKLRQRLAEIKRDLYLVDSEIPTQAISPQFLVDVNKVAIAWLQKKERREPLSPTLLPSQRYYWILGALAFGLLLTFFYMMIGSYGH